MMHFLDKQWFGPVSTVRLYLFQKCFTLMLAFDLLVLMVERGARYGADAIPFNVAHFSWLDVFHRWIANAGLGLFLPEGVPSETYYVAVLTLTSFCSFCLFVGGYRRWLMAIVCTLFTYSWAMSRLDSYLHHYMLSLIMLCMVFFPPVHGRILFSWLTQQDSTSSVSTSKQTPRAGNGAKEWVNMLGLGLLGLALLYRILLSQMVALSEGQRWFAMCIFFAVAAGIIFWGSRSTPSESGPMTSAWSMRLLMTTVGVIYIFAAVAKMDSEWCMGHTLKAVGATEFVLQPLVGIAESLGISADTFWALLATLVIPLELCLAAIYLLSVWQDNGHRKWLSILCFVGWLLAVGLHLNNEMMNLVIQWFGYYMLLLATILLVPARYLLIASTVFFVAECWLQDRVEKLLASRKDSLIAMATTTFLAILILFAFAFLTLIPGMVVAAAFVGMLLILTVAFGIIVGWNKSVLAVGLTTGASVLAMICAVSQSTLQFDYHALRGKTLMNVGKIRPAKDALEEAQHYPAPSRMMAAEARTNLAIAYVKLLEPSGVGASRGTTDDRRRSEKRIEELFRSALELDPQQFVGFYGFGNFLVRQGRHAEAERAFLSAISVKPDYSDAYFNLGSLYESNGRLHEAIRCYEAVAEIEPYAQDVQQQLTAVRSKLKEATSSKD